MTDLQRVNVEHLFHSEDSELIARVGAYKTSGEVPPTGTLATAEQLEQFARDAVAALVSDYYDHDTRRMARG